tara:strand:+ start:12053 stop:13717 length:1665 start_codon:yes stop_codon:yes gene_type:complete
MNKILSITIVLCLCASPLYVPRAHAQDVQAMDYTALESTGLLGDEDANSLGTGIYRHANRADLVSLLKNINHTPWVALQSTIKNLLLTSADSKAINNDIPITKGQDLLTLRITALLRMGYNRAAFELYNKASDSTLDEPLIRAGIFSMLLNKQKALACLEVKTSFKKYSDLTFWKEMNAFCTLSLSKEKQQSHSDIIDQSDHKILKTILDDETFRFEYNPQTFQALSFLERAALTAEDRIILPASDEGLYKSIPPQHLAALLVQSNMSEQTKAILTTAAVENGIEAPKALSALYEGILEHYKNNPPKNNDWYTLAFLFDETKAGWLPKKRKDKVAEAFNIAKNYGDAALIPFLPALEHMHIGDDLSLEDAYRAARLFLYSDMSPPNDWIDDLLGLHYDDVTMENTRLKLLTALSVMTKADDGDQRAKVKETLNKFLFSDQKKYAFKNIIENIDISENNSDKVRYIDANGFDLVWNNRYTMPPYVVLRALKQSSRNQDTSVSLLLSAYMLGKISTKDIYVGTLDDIVIALNDSGLTQLSHRMVAQAVLQMETEGE